MPDDPAAAGEPQPPRRDLPTHLLRPVDEPVRDAIPTFRMRAVPEAEPGDAPGPGLPPEAAAEPEPPEVTAAPPTFPLRALPDPPTGHAPGTVVPPTGEFGPPPVMDARPEPVSRLEPTPPAPPAQPVSPAQVSPPVRPAQPSPPVRPAASAAPLLPDLGREPEPEPKPTPPRGFDAVAEAVLGDDPMAAPGDGTAPPLLAEPLARINEAVKAGRTDAAAELADRTLAQASGTLGPEHPEVLRLRELAAYIAYLAGDPVRSFQLSLDLAQVRHHTRDAEAAYGNIQSAFTAWRAVRDPLVGLELGRALIGLWAELTAEDGPAADDIEQLDKARARMGRLTERAQNAR
ncbi:tetratricopeptide repeat protein [Streptomyces sp. NPDC058678]|uniref:tetratricopeptide repeat protein n=1 Tax=Streptomyces sp. NPDC058678 TaxID=3346595 RepID=UPI0036623219